MQLGSEIQAQVFTNCVVTSSVNPAQKNCIVQGMQSDT